MQHSFSYDKKKVIQALRYHFVKQPEIRVLVILVNVFAVISAVLLWMKKIRPEPFLLGSVIWLGLMATFWYFLPNSIYKKANTFQDSFIIDFLDDEVRLENERGYVQWPWQKFNRYFESPHFFHLYFNSRSFFIIPKEAFEGDEVHEARKIFKAKIGKK